MLHRSLHKTYPAAVRGEGSWLFDVEGNRYLDFASSAVVNFIGHGDPAVARVMSEQAKALEFAHSSSFTTSAAEQFAAELLDFAGPAFRDGAVFFTSGGSEAVESALKLARQYHVERGDAARCQVVSRYQSYHGATLGAMAVSGNPSRREIYLPMLREFPKANTPNCYRCHYSCTNGCEDCALKYAAEVEQAIAVTNGSAAAFIMEPISGATLGAVVPAAAYVRRVAEICRDRGVLLIADEVMTGFGRTGRRFAMDHWDVAPDILAVGKGISSGYLPLGAVLAQAHVVDAIANGSGMLLHGFTYNGHPVAVAAGLAVLRRIRERHLAEAADSGRDGSLGAILQQELQKLWALKSVGDVRGVGLLWAVEFVADKETKDPFPAAHQFATRVNEAAIRRGVLLYPMQGCALAHAISSTTADRGRQSELPGDHVMVAPPAVTHEDDIRWAVAQIAEAIAETERQLPRS